MSKVLTWPDGSRGRGGEEGRTSGQRGLVVEVARAPVVFSVAEIASSASCSATAGDESISAPVVLSLEQEGGECLEMELEMDCQPCLGQGYVRTAGGGLAQPLPIRPLLSETMDCEQCDRCDGTGVAPTDNGVEMLLLLVAMSAGPDGLEQVLDETFERRGMRLTNPPDLHRFASRWTR